MNQSEETDVQQSQTRSKVEIIENKFDFVFLLPLKHVDSDIPLEQIIFREHDLDDKIIIEDDIKTILDSSRSLLIFDGYDEYKKGTNFAIHAAINGDRPNSFFIITSRPDYMDKKDKNKLDGEIQNNGLSVHNIKKCTQNYLEDAEKTDDFLKKAVSQRLSKLLRTPILLIMMCVLYIQNNTLPKNRGTIIRDIIHMYIMRAQERGVHFGKRCSILLALGELSYEASQRRTHKLLIRKNDIEKKGNELLKLGLLQGDMVPHKTDTGIRKESEWMTFPHKLFMDYVIAFYIELHGKAGINLLSSVDGDVRRVLLDITHNVWFYVYHGLRIVMMLADRLIDVAAIILFVDYGSRSTPHWEVCLGAYIVLRFASFALCYDTDRWEYYVVRTALLLIISGLLCNVAMSLPLILDTQDETNTIQSVLSLLVFFVVYVSTLVRGYNPMLDCPILKIVHDPFKTRWFNIFYNMRRWLMWLDRGSDVFLIYILVFYHTESAPYGKVFLYVYGALRLVSLPLFCGTSFWEHYLVRTLLLYVTSGLCHAALCAPLIAYKSDGWWVFIFFFVLFRALYLGLFVLFYVNCSQRESKQTLYRLNPK